MLKSFAEFFDLDDSQSDFISEAKDLEDPEDLLIDAGYKIKLTIPTNFGTEYVLAKKYPESELKKLLKDFDYQIKGNSVFISY